MTTVNARPPPLVLMIYRDGGEGYGDYLRASGFRVEEAHSGPHGLDRALVSRPDLIVLDFGLDGETAARLRREPATSGIPVIALTELSNLHRAAIAPSDDSS
jgi:DNA-binding response OmpR family regulator